MPNANSPGRPNLEQYKKIAKDIVKAWNADVPTAIPWEGHLITVTREHLRLKHPRLSALDENDARAAKMTIAEAQFMIARECGFGTWAEFAASVEDAPAEPVKKNERWAMDIPPRSVVHTRHVLAVKNLRTSGDYFRERLGFELDFTAPGWEFLSFGAFKVMLGECTDAFWAHETGDHSYFAHCLVENVDEVYQELRSRGANILHPIGDKPWGLREFGVITPDGHRITYGQVINE